MIKYLYSAFFIIRFCSCNIIANNTFRITNKPACQLKDPFCNTCGLNNVCAACKSGFSLSGGKCCPSSTTNCGGFCLNTLFSNNNCGTCGKTCPLVTNGFDQCLFGGCTTLCKKGFNKCGNQCVIIGTDVTNCGSCGIKCSAPVNGTTTCVSGKCGFVCDKGYTNCSGKCVNNQTDTANCGSCNNVCPSAPIGSTAQPVCSSGKCGFYCSSNQTLCGTSCVDVTSDPNNCGTCAHSCPSPTNGNGISTCTASMCGITCNTGFIPCNGACISTTNDPNNCGACGKVCPGGLCESSLCGTSSLLTFDDVDPNINFANFPDYDGFRLNNFYIANANNNGFAQGLVSPPNILYGSSGSSTMQSYSPFFDLVNLYATSITDRDTLTITATYQGNPVNSQSFVLSSTYPTQIFPAFVGIDFATFNINNGVIIDNVFVNIYS